MGVDGVAVDQMANQFVAASRSIWGGAANESTITHLFATSQEIGSDLST